MDMELLIDLKFRQLIMKYLILTQIKIIGYNFKTLIIFSLWIYILRLLSPFLFKILISSLLKKLKSLKLMNIKKERKRLTSQSFGEYI